MSNVFNVNKQVILKFTPNNNLANVSLSLLFMAPIILTALTSSYTLSVSLFSSGTWILQIQYSQQFAISSRSFQVLASSIPVPSFIPPINHKFNEYFTFHLNFPAIHAALYLAYYFLLEPVAAVSRPFLNSCFTLCLILLLSSCYILRRWSSHSLLRQPTRRLPQILSRPELYMLFLGSFNSWDMGSPRNVPLHFWTIF